MLLAIRFSKKDFERLTGKKTNAKTKTKNKYNNKKIFIGGKRYDSEKEFLRHRELIVLERAGAISQLRFHDKQDLLILIEKPLLKYEPDFCYIENGKLIIEDLKGYQTKEFKVKKKIIASKIFKGEINAIFRLTKYEDGKFKIIEEYNKAP